MCENDFLGAEESQGQEAWYIPPIIFEHSRFFRKVEAEGCRTIALDVADTVEN